MDITWLGHGTILLELDGRRLITDPVLRNRIGPLVRVAPPVTEPALDHLDAVLLSHLHADHADPASLRRLGSAVRVIAARASEPWLRRQGVRHTTELEPGESVSLDGIEITATSATHDGRRRPLGPWAEPVGFLVSGSQSAYYAGDTDLFPAMATLRGRVDVALLPVWGWGPKLGPGHLDPERAARAVALINPAVAIPVHWGTFALGFGSARLHSPSWPAVQFAALVGRYAPGVDVKVLNPGERFHV
jgi:L-ascorbate metabolism protein UlaG (beta-lactamase superfamily)